MGIVSANVSFLTYICNKFAIVPNLAQIAFGVSGGAYISAMQDEPMVRKGYQMSGNVLGQGLFGLQRRAAVVGQS